MTAIASNTYTPILTITGSDSTSGSGIQADIKTINTLGGYAVTAITSVTVQNTLGIQDFYDLPPDIVRGQIDAIINDVQPQVVKIGMVRRPDVMAMLADVLRRYQPPVVIYDPVVVSTHGDVLMAQDVVEVMRTQLLPQCTLVVLKQSDAEHILGRHIATSAETVGAAADIMRMGCQHVLVHCARVRPEASTDILLSACDKAPVYLTDVYGEHNESHGMSGHLSAAIAAFLSKGQSMDEAVANAAAYTKALATDHGRLTGRGSELYNEFVNEIASHYSTHNDVRFYADRLNVSSTYLAQVTKRIAGKAPKAIIDEYVMAEAQAMLLQPGHTIQEIAYAMGFSTQAHFSKVFRKMAGCSPRDFRRNKGAYGEDKDCDV